MVAEAITVSAPVYLRTEFGYNTLNIAFFLSIISFLVVPSSFLIDKYFKHYQERNVIIVLTIISTVCCIFLISVPYFDMTLTRFYFFVSILFIAAYVLESFTSSLLAKIFPPSLKERSMCNSGFIIIFSSTGGKLCGAIIITLFGLMQMDLANSIYGFFLVMYGFISFVIYHKYSDLRIKAVARVIQRQGN